MVPREKYGVTLQYYEHRMRREKEIRAAHAAGLTPKEAAAKLGVSQATICGWKQRLHLSDFVRPEHYRRRREREMAP
jgi:transposase